MWQSPGSLWQGLSASRTRAILGKTFKVLDLILILDLGFLRKLFSIAIWSMDSYTEGYDHDEVFFMNQT